MPSLITIVFVDGHYQPSLSAADDLRQYITLADNQFTLQLPPAFRCQSLVHLQHIGKTSGSYRIAHRIVVGERSEVTVVHTYHGDHSIEYTHHSDVMIQLQPGAQLRYYKWQSEGERAHHHGQMIAHQATDSYLATYHIARGGYLSDDSFHYLLEGKNATCESTGFYQTGQQQQLAVTSRIHHLDSFTSSRQLYKGTADDHSYAKFHGKVVVEPQIKQVCASQKNDNLLLSRQAQVDTKPELEIYADDVSCSHGATVGQLDETALFYLRSRGIDAVAARQVLIDGFASEIIDSLSHHVVVNDGMMEVIDG